MSEIRVSRQSVKYTDHFVFNFIILLAFTLVTFIIRLTHLTNYILSDLFSNQVGENLDTLFLHYYPTLIISIFMLLLVRVISTVVPVIYIENAPNWYVIAFPILILSHPFLIIYTAGNLQVIWQIKDII
ncbi:MAG: hypothetical protein ACXAD7_23320, partial [Candidatus Kariarchaeaceae archaeon]